MWLDSSSSIVSSILTRAGRAALAKNDGSFNISSFSFFDDEINYSLYNPITQNDQDILNLPILEPSSNENTAAKYRLVTLPQGTISIGYLSVSPAQLVIARSAAATMVAPNFGNISVQTADGSDPNGYIVISRNQNIAYAQITNVPSTINSDGQTVATVTILPGSTDGITIIDITGKDTGSTVSVPVTVTSQTIGQ